VPVLPDGHITSVGGTSGLRYSGDGGGNPQAGSATTTPITRPVTVTGRPGGGLYVLLDNRIVKILGVAPA
jgi:hypothetical protein